MLKPQDGRGILSITRYYCVTSLSSGVTKSTIGLIWVAITDNTVTPPRTDSVNRYLWMYEVTVFDRGPAMETVPIIVGVHGVDGVTPRIDPTTKRWIVDGQLTDIVAEGMTYYPQIIDGQLSFSQQVFCRLMV